jgi:hypothetical protein
MIGPFAQAEEVKHTVKVNFSLVYPKNLLLRARLKVCLRVRTTAWLSVSRFLLAQVAGRGIGSHFHTANHPRSMRNNVLKNGSHWHKSFGDDGSEVIYA